MIIDTEQLYKCETCSHTLAGKCTTYCDHGESYTPAFSKLKPVDSMHDVIAPYKERDTFYEVDGEHGVVSHTVQEVFFVFNTVAMDDNGDYWDDQWTSEDFDNIYSTREEADAALDELRDR